MSILPLLCITLMVMVSPVNAGSGINIDKVIINHNSKIKKLNQKYKSLLNEIDQLREHQKVEDTKVKELFRLLEFRQTKEVVEQTVTRIKKDNIKAKKLYSSARSLLLTDQYEEAVLIFKKYMDEYPDNSNADDAHYWLARSYYAMQDHVNARNTFLVFQQDNPKHHKFSNSLLELSRVYVELNEKDKAIDMLKLMVKKTPNHKSINKVKQLLTELTKPTKELVE